MVTFRMGRCTLVRVSFGVFAVHLGDVYFGLIQRIECSTWQYVTRPLGPPFGSVIHGGYTTAGEAAEACIQRSLQ